MVRSSIKIFRKHDKLTSFTIETKMSKKSFGNDGIQANAPKFEKNVARTLQRGYSASGYFRMRGHERLSGGADAKSKSTVNLSKSGLEANNKVTPEASSSSKVALEAEEEIEAILAKSNDQESTGDKKVDEMIDYVIQNLHEAGKALASLGENFEHDLKLMFVDVMGKVQNWVSIAQIRLDAARDDLNNLRKELVSRSNELAVRDREIAEFKKKLTESEVAKSIYEKALAESVQKSVVPLPTPSTMSFVPSRQPMPTGVSAAPSGHIAADSQHLPDEISTSAHPLDASVTSAQSSHPVSPGAASGHPLSAHGEGPEDATSIATIQNQQHHGSASEYRRLLESQTITRDQRSRSQQRLPEAPLTADVAVQSARGKERKRESELESELARLRKENEKIAKERADYENAIQRALLRGVSSLNAETLKVLRCPPPISCYTPCGPPPSPVNTVETMTSSCSTTKTKNDKRAAGCRTAPMASSKRGSSKIRVNENIEREERECCGTKRPTTTVYGSSSRYRKSSGSSSRSMALLLQNAASPAACNAPCNTSHVRSCSRTKPRKLEASVCTRKLE